MEDMSQQNSDPVEVFVSYASEQRTEVARPLADILSSLGVRVWYDEFELKLGDSLRRSIDRGLAECRFGVVILSHDFFAKHHTQRELDGLAQREVEGQKVLIPIWYDVNVSWFSGNRILRPSADVSSGWLRRPSAAGRGGVVLAPLRVCDRVRRGSAGRDLRACRAA